MKILFNVYNVGLGNNGGSLTLVRSANELIKLGINVKVVSGGSNLHTWSTLLGDHIVVKDLSEFPPADVVMATGMRSVQSTLNCSSPIKIHWIRGFETWVYPEDKLIKILKESPTIKIVNSICLEKKLRSYKIGSYLIRPGYDFEDYYPTNSRSSNKIILGGIYNEGTKRRTKRADWIFKCFSALKDRYENIELWMYGSENRPNSNLVSYYKKDANEAEKNYIYNNVSIWLSPTCLEGLHMPAAEAGLAECCIIATEAEMSGTQDYLTHNVTGLVSRNNINSFIEVVESAINNESLRSTLGKELRTKILSLGNRRENMSKFLEMIKAVKGEG